MPFQLPPVTRNLLIINIVVFVLQNLAWQVFLFYGALWPLGSGAFEPWQLLTSAFMHGGVQHILFNMLALYMFGGPIEQLFGGRKFTLYYLVCALTASLLQLAVLRYFQPGEFFPTLGASGAIFGLLLAFGMMYPKEKVFFMLLPIPIQARWFVLLYAAAELFLGVSGLLPGVAHFAHLGGMLGGYLLIEYWRGRMPIKPRQRLLR